MEFKVILVVTKRTMKSRNTVIKDIFKKIKKFFFKFVMNKSLFNFDFSSLDISL